MPTTDLPQHPHIRSFRVAGGGYLDGVEMRFAPGGNVVCGDHGVGKSTALAILRYALALPVPDAKKAEQAEIVAHNLGAGRAYVTIRALGVDYEFSRAAGESAPRLESPKSAAAFLPSELTPFRFAGHGEFMLMATDGLARLELLERFAVDDMKRVGAALARVRKELDDNAGDLARLDRETQALKKECGDLAKESGKLDELKKAAGGDPIDLETANKVRALGERERMMVVAAEREVAWLDAQMTELATTAERRLAQAIDVDVVAHGPNAAALADVAGALHATRDALEAARARVHAECEASRAIFAARAASIAEAHAKEDDVYRAILAKHETNNLRAHERMKLERRVAELTKAKETLDLRTHERARVNDARDAMRARLRAALAERLAILQRTAAKIDAETRGLVQIDIEPEAERTKYLAHLAKIVKGKRFEGADIALVAAKISPEDLVAQVLRGDTSVLAEKIGSSGIAMRLAGVLAEDGRIYELESVEVEDVPVIRLRHGETYKESEKLSSGQRTIAFVSILLLDKRGPLIADQPEDNLANRYLAQHLCVALAESQDEQFIFVTHNGNIPILGRAQKVFELQADGERAWVSAHGESKTVQEPMENNFEGGREAFVVRKEFYGVE